MDIDTAVTGTLVRYICASCGCPLSAIAPDAEVCDRCGCSLEFAIKETIQLTASEVLDAVPAANRIPF